jgi:hypothetical protein
LYVLSESGTLYSRFPLASASPDLEAVASNMKDAWSFVWSDEGPVVTDVAGRRWWSSEINPGRLETLGTIGLHDPWIEDRDGAETLMLRGAVSSIYHGFIQDKLPDTNVIWRNEVRPSRIIRVEASGGGAALVYSPFLDAGASRLEMRRAGSIGDVMEDIAEISRSGGDTPRVVVLDTRISASDDELAIFLSFLLHQGTRLDLWAAARPASALMGRVSRITLGRSYYSSELGRVPFNDSMEWILSLPLPPDTSTFGYPSEATLSVFSSIDAIRFVDWLPVWPSLMNRK